MRDKHFVLCFTTSSWANIWFQLNAFKPPSAVAKAVVRSKAVFLLLLIRC